MYIDIGTLTALLLLFFLIGIAWLWNDSLRARDHVIGICHRLCDEVGVQFLDETVALSRLRMRRAVNGRLALARRYTFEYSNSGSDRWQGYALMTGMLLESVQLQGPDGVIILGSSTPAQPGKKGYLSAGHAGSTRKDEWLH